MAKRRANGEGSISRRKDGLWMAQFIDNEGKRRTLYGKTQQEVRLKLKQSIRESDDGLLLERGKIKFSEWLEEWLEVYSRPNVRQSSYNVYHNAIYKHVIPSFPNVLLKDLRGDMLQRFFNEKAKSGKLDASGGLSYSVLVKIKIVINSSLEQAVKNDIIRRNVARDIKLPPRKPVRDNRVLTIQEQAALEAVLIASNEPTAYAVYLTLYTGMRRGEVAALSVKDIDFEKKQLHVGHTIGRIQIAGTGHSEVVMGEPKTDKSNRIIPLPPFVVDLLKKYIETIRKPYAELRALYIESPKTYIVKMPEVDFLFLNSAGNALDKEYTRVTFNRYLKLAGIEHINFHALRHTFATRCIEMGFDVH